MKNGPYRPDWLTEKKTLEQRRTVLEIATRGKRMIDITDRVAEWLTGAGALEGLMTVFVQHTSASLTIQENADPAVQADLLDALERIAPEAPGRIAPEAPGRIAPQGAGYRHTSEGPDDMPAHIKAMLTCVSLAIPVIDARMALGTWQGVYLVEHRWAPHVRNVVLHFIGSVRA